jgi:hypothetical protein
MPALGWHFCFPTTCEAGRGELSVSMVSLTLATGPVACPFFGNAPDRSRLSKTAQEPCIYPVVFLMYCFSFDDIDMGLKILPAAFQRREACP